MIPDVRTGDRGHVLVRECRGGRHRHKRKSRDENGRRLVVDTLTDAAIQRSSIRFRIGGPVYVAAMVVALVSAPASLAIIGGLAIYYLLPAGGAIAHPAER